MRSDTLRVGTGSREVVHDLTADCERFVADAAHAAHGDGLLHVFVPHATAGLIVMETGSGSEEDLEETLDRLLPKDDRYVHRHGSRGHGADHLLPLLASPSLTVPVIGGRAALGTWQRICLLDRNRDNPRRKVRLSFLSG
jgi:secondary thiamine-phosphate synthase enzyme